jgi:hypothetical protein
MFGVSFWEQFILTTVMGILAGLKKDPSKVPHLKTILTHIVNDICQLLGVTPPTIP